jgi:small redox-active disulfide protein 2
LKPVLPAPVLLAQVDERKCPAMETCPAIPACPEGAIRHVADRKTKLGGRIVIELAICTGCGDCVSACCGNAITLAEIIPVVEEKPTKGETNMLTVKVLGGGCANCVNLQSNAQRAINALSIEAKVEKVTDHAEFTKYRLLATPGLVINEKLVSAGRVPNEAEITTFLTNALLEE